MAGKYDAARARLDPAPGGVLGDVLAAAGTVYDAAMDPGSWPEALTIVAETLGAAAAVLFLGDPGRDPAVVGRCLDAVDGRAAVPRSTNIAFS